MLKSTLSVVLSLFLAMSCSCFGETMMPLEKEIETSSPSQAKKILKVTWRHNLNNAPFQVYFGKSEWEYRTEEMAVLDSEIDILTISYLFPWVYVNTVHGDIFPHVFKINGKKFHIIPAHPQQHHHYADFFDLLAKVRMKYELKEWRDNTSPVGLLFIETNEMNFAFIYEEENEYFISFYQDARLTIGTNQLVTMSFKKQAKMKIRESYYHYLIHFSYIWDSPAGRIPYK